MKVKALTTNIMVDYKKVDKGQVIDLPEDTAKRFVKAELVESIVKADQEEVKPLTVIVDGKEVNLVNKTVKELEEFCADNGLGITQENGEKKDAFVQRIKEAFDLKQTQE